MRRIEFLTTVAALTGVPGMLTARGAASGSGHRVEGMAVKGVSAAAGDGAAMTIRQVIDALQRDIPGAPFASTVDTIKAGDPDQAVKGIVTTMFATLEVIGKAVSLGANFIIAHEPTY